VGDRLCDNPAALWARRLRGCRVDWVDRFDGFDGFDG
jgi:hypothetical protein